MVAVVATRLVEKATFLTVEKEVTVLPPRMERSAIAWAQTGEIFMVK